MAAEIIFCPNCRNKLRVPDEMMGQMVRCPSCQSEFAAPPPLAQARPPEEGAERETAGPPEYPELSVRRSEVYREDQVRAAGPNPYLLIFGAALVAVSLLSLADDLFQMATFSAQDAQDRVREFQKSFPMVQVPDQQTLVRTNHIMMTVFSLFSIVALAGGLAMLRRKLFPLAVLGSILAIINLTADCCCLLGAPVGIACLVVLFQPRVKASFYL